ncbi:hypothetical protein I5F07_17790 [Proteus vulgaris]|uniref:hypothetical protein n=1 Tax=Proteus TaxID=583 RepID=UPI0018C797B7|nr:MULTISPECIES: hypothetical protein [Proteus]MBG2804224.1 hypothetical protein [Proteus mirabilis]MBG2839317.1 hypothetical protein [Proteus terrae subsp. cibarius]MBG5986700.1 hypothetical protein [Proteus vulgaris]MBI6217620.1 hypothetical protein [Proteus vulgaris]MCO8051971.1 hypothetical protein [Proteus penneri]
MCNQKQVKLSKLFRSGRFVGHALSVDGELLSNQKLVVLPPADGLCKQVDITVTLTCTNDMIMNAPDIHLK